MNVVRARAAEGNRHPGLVDTKVVPGILFNNLFSLQFDGVDERVTGPAMAALFTVVDKLSTPSSLEGVVNAAPSLTTAANNGWGLHWFGSDRLNFWISRRASSNNFALTDTSGPGLVGLGTWNFIVGVFDATASPTVKIYTNAFLNSNVGTSAEAPGSAGANIELGRSSNSETNTTRFAHANLDEMSIWKTALSQDEITSLYNNGVPINLAKNSGDYVSSADLELWWRCGDKNDSNTTDGIQDASGNGHSATMVNMEDTDIVTDAPGV